MVTLPPERTVPRILLCSHDGLGLGHVRRNCRIAEAILRRHPGADITVITGVSSRHDWLDGAPMRVVRVPTLAKGPDGAYRHESLSLAHALSRRSRVVLEEVERLQPHVVVVDRHPTGIDGELRPGLRAAKRAGAAVILGLRDILDEPSAIRTELAGPGWADLASTVDEVLVYGQPLLCDHAAEYALPMRPTYVGVVTAPEPAGARGGWATRHTDDLLVVTAGGGSDGSALTELARGASGHPKAARTVLIAGPDAYAAVGTDPRIEVVTGTADCTPWYAAAAASLQMAGYNSTFEAIAAGLRPILVPRRRPRREQAIRAGRLAALGLADLLDHGGGIDDVRWLLDQPRRVTGEQVRRAGLDLGGADRAAARLLALAGAASLNRSAGAVATLEAVSA